MYACSYEYKFYLFFITEAIRSAPLIGIYNKFSFLFLYLQQEAAAAAAAQNSTNESNSSNLAANNSNQPPPPSNQQQQHQQAPSNNVGPGAQPNNPQQSMRPISSPNSSSSGSRSMSPAVGKFTCRIPCCTHKLFTYAANQKLYQKMFFFFFFSLFMLDNSRW